MQMARAATRALLLLGPWSISVQAEEDQTNPISKVVQLMDDLYAKVTKEGEEEAKAYSEFTAWCKDAARNKEFEIKESSKQKEKLEAAIGNSESEAAAASARIEELAASLAASESDLKDATAVRDKEAADFTKKEEELIDIVDTLGRAITVLEREMAKHKSTFLQSSTGDADGILKSFDSLIDAAAFSTTDRHTLMNLLQAKQSEADDELGPPAAAAYKSRSGSIVDTIEDMSEKAQEQLAELRKAETNAKHNYDMLRQSLEDQMGVDKEEMQRKKTEKSEAEEAKAGAEGDLERAIKALQDAHKTQDTVKTDCLQTASDHEATTKSRHEELKVIAEAKKIIVDSTSGAQSQSYSMVQLRKTVSNLKTSADLANTEVLKLLQKLAKENHSGALAQLATRIKTVLKLGAASGEDPFAKVKGLISELIERLKKEASAEADEKAYCDEQLVKTKAKKEHLEGKMSALVAKIDKAGAKSTTLKGEVKQFQEELAALAKQQAEMDAARQEAHAAFVQAKADLEEGLAGVRKALVVLRDYYGGSSSTALIETTASQPAAPESHNKASGAAHNIIGMLEVVEADFAEDMANQETEEESGRANYEQMTQENSITKVQKEQDVKYTEKEAKETDKLLAELRADRETGDAELSAVLEYWDKVRDRCIAKPESYETRKARREAEIKGLKEALKILQDEAALVQQKKKGWRQHFLGF